jgi:pyrimidine and pyridine-specific 5'-nucleotidase
VQTPARILSFGGWFGINDQDFSHQNLHNKALKQANVSDPSKCFFVDDSRKNIDAARSLGWGACVHFCEAGLQVVEGGKLKEIGDERVQGAADNDIPVISDLEELRVVWPQIF